MAAKKPTKSSKKAKAPANIPAVPAWPTKLRKPLRKDTKIALLILVVPFLIAFIWHEVHLYYTFHTQKADFSKVELNMKSIISEIQSNDGNAYELNSDKSCSYASFGSFGRGPLSCSISHSFTYQVSGIDEGKNLTLKILDTIHAKTGHTLSYEPQPNEITDQLSASFSNGSDFDCKLTYELTTQDQYNHYSPNRYNKLLTAQYAAVYKLSCAKSVVKPIYSLE